MTESLSHAPAASDLRLLIIGPSIVSEIQGLPTFLTQTPHLSVPVFADEITAVTDSSAELHSRRLDDVAWESGDSVPHGKPQHWRMLCKV